MVNQERLEQMKETKSPEERVKLNTLVENPLKIINDIYNRLEEAIENGERDGVVFGIFGLAKVLNRSQYLEIISQEDYERYSEKMDKVLKRETERTK